MAAFEVLTEVIPMRAQLEIGELRGLVAYWTLVYCR